MKGTLKSSGPSASDLAGCLREIAEGKGRPVYLLRGDEYLCRTAAQELAQAFVPEASRGLNLVGLDAAASPAQVAEELRTVPMFRGTKAVWVQPAEFLAPRKATRGDPLARLRELWGAGKQREATRRLLALAGRAGFELEGLEQRSAEGWAAAGFKLEPGDRELIAGAVELAQAEGLAIPEGDTRALEALLAAGLPEGHHLILAVEEIDAASPLVRLCRAGGVELERSIAAPSGPPGKQGAPDVRALVAEQLGPLGKTMAPDAARLLVSRAGRDARLLASELSKLASYVGDRSKIEAQDVLDLVPQTVGEDYFALSNALEARDLRALLKALEDEIERDSAPLRVLAGLAASVRGLLTMRAQLGAAGVKPGLAFPEFERRVFPAIALADRAAGRKPSHPFRAFKRAEACQRYGRDELAQAMVLLAEADIGMKRGMDGQAWLTRLCFRLGAPPRRPS